MRSALPTVVLVAVILAGCGTAASSPAGPDPSVFADRLAADAVASPVGGRVWTSVIQAPHRQTDRDVGAAGIASGLLTLAASTPDPAARTRMIDTARATGDFLLGAQRPEPGRVPDYVDPGGPSDVAYSSFDDGAAGVADLLWRLGEVTGDRRYTDGALDGVAYLLRRAEGVDGAACPQRCRWAWSDQGEPSYRHGMGEGAAGVVYALSVFAERTGDPRIAAHARGGAEYLASRLDPDGGLPERSDEPRRNTGFLSGSAGAAFVFLRMFQATGESRWRDLAESALGFLDRTAVPAGRGVTWPILLGAGADAAVPANPRRATGMEEGAAGIGWVSLQAHVLTGDRRHLERARAAGRWLVDVALREAPGWTWAEYEGASTVHTSTNSGAAGTGWFLHDLGLVTGEAEFVTASVRARDWLLGTATPEGRWHASRERGVWVLAGEPSWHWGGAGVLGFLARMGGGPVDSPGMQPALVPLGPAAP